MIKIYTTNTSPSSIKVKNYFKSENIEFQELNVQDDIKVSEEMINKSNQMGVPVLDINNLIGFDKPAILNSIGK